MDDAVTADFLSKAMGVPVEIVKRKDLIGGVLSFASMVTLAYPEGGGEGKPKTVVVKIPTDVQCSRDFAVMLNAYIKEVNVYKLLRPALDSMDFKTPKLFYADHDGTTDDWCEWFVLVIEAFDPDAWMCVHSSVLTRGARYRGISDV